MTRHLINEVIRKNCVEALNQHAQPIITIILHRLGSVESLIG